jgi:levansucrase
MTAQSGRWLPQHVAAIAAAPLPHGPVITAAQAAPLLPGTDLWDMWPLQNCDGSTADVAGGHLWFILSAPVIGGPDERHFIARIRLLFARGGIWHDLGLALPADHGPGNREWSGSAILDGDRVTLFFTAAGVHGSIGGYRQRLVSAQAQRHCDTPLPRLSGWTIAAEVFAADGVHYRIVDQTEGAIGKIKAFRDPGYFRDPADGASYLLFTGSLAGSSSGHDGCIGVARAATAGDGGRPQ